MEQHGRFEVGGEVWTWSTSLGGSYGWGGEEGPGPGQWLLQFRRESDGHECHTFVRRDGWPDRPSEDRLAAELRRAQDEEQR